MKKFLLTAFVAVAMASAQAKVTLPYVMGNNMILQQQTEARLWGKTTAKEVKVTTSWDNEVYTAKASKKRRFHRESEDAQGQLYTAFHYLRRRRPADAQQHPRRRGVGLRRTVEHGDARKGIRQLSRGGIQRCRGDGQRI